ncbi:MAG: hypothetical protein ABJA71_16080 [Ginsengibacter sp.]
MKKISLFIVSALLLGTISASAQRVILRLDNNYEVNIDGRYYNNNETVPSLANGSHTVSLYQVRGGVLGIGKRRTLVSSSRFDLRNNDVIIENDQNGQLRINEVGNNTSRNSGDRSNERTTSGKNGKGYGPYNNPGKGHKYGLYKNKKNKNNQKRHDDENEQ